MSYFQTFNFQELVIIPTKVDLDIIHPATGEVSESDEESPGGLVAIKENANTPVTELLLRNIEPISVGGVFKLIFSPGNFKIWLNSNGTGEVLSNSTTMSATANTMLYLEGISESGSLGAEQIEVVWTDGTTTLACGERVHLTIVEAEFDVVHRVFIPYNWVNVPHFAHSTHVAEGDDRSFDSTLSGTFRVEQRMRLIPFEELASNLLSQVQAIPGTTRHFHNSDVTNHTGAIHSGLEPITPSFINSTASPVTGEVDNADVSAVTVVPLSSISHQVKVNIKGAAAEPIVFAAAPIDWDFQLTISSQDPLNPIYSLSGAHDGFPAYEIYINTQDTNTPVTDVLKWTPDFTDSVIKLLGGADNPIPNQVNKTINQ